MLSTFNIFSIFRISRVLILCNNTFNIGQIPPYSRIYIATLAVINNFICHPFKKLLYLPSNISTYIVFLYVYRFPLQGFSIG